ncbi:putative catechol oxidase [Helianthus anomalus]
MRIPEFFIPKDINGKPNPIQCDVHREASHLSAVVNLNYRGEEEGFSEEKQIACNLYIVYRELDRTEGEPLSFFGGKYVAGSDPVPSGDKKSIGCGSVERGSHTVVHR